MGAHSLNNSTPALRAEILCHAHCEDQVDILQWAGLKNTNITHSALLREHARWATAIISCGEQICIELSVSGDNAFALNKLKDLGLDIFGAHRASFSFQGGPNGAEAFRPDAIAKIVFGEIGDIHDVLG